MYKCRSDGTRPLYPLSTLLFTTNPFGVRAPHRFEGPFGVSCALSHGDVPRCLLPSRDRSDSSRDALHLRYTSTGASPCQICIRSPAEDGSWHGDIRGSRRLVYRSLALIEGLCCPSRQLAYRSSTAIQGRTCPCNACCSVFQRLNYARSLLLSR